MVGFNAAFSNPQSAVALGLAKILPGDQERGGGPLPYTHADNSDEIAVASRAYSLS
jgi:hypothetical protein